jgi:hypothetical protein
MRVHQLVVTGSRLVGQWVQCHFTSTYTIKEAKVLVLYLEHLCLSRSVSLFSFPWTYYIAASDVPLPIWSPKSTDRRVKTITKWIDEGDREANRATSLRTLTAWLRQTKLLEASRTLDPPLETCQQKKGCVRSQQEHEAFPGLYCSLWHAHTGSLAGTRELGLLVGLAQHTLPAHACLTLQHCQMDWPPCKFLSTVWAEGRTKNQSLWTGKIQPQSIPLFPSKY